MTISWIQVSREVKATLLHRIRRGRAGPVRFALYLYLLLVACPIRYFPMEYGFDTNWRFALNYAQVHGLSMGRDIVFTTGPLVYLIFPEHIGKNLKQGLLFQALLWMATAAILADIFFHIRPPLRNLAMFSCYFCLAAPIFWFSVLGPENLMVVGALILLVVYHFHGGMSRLLAGLALIGLLPLFKLSGAVIGAAALAGFLLDRFLTRRRKAIGEVLIALLLPAAIAVGLLRLVLPSWQALQRFLQGSADVISGYSTAMSLTGPNLELLFALNATGALMAFLWVQFQVGRKTARFFALFLFFPLFISFKHGFVRQDSGHISAFFCFVAISLALVSLAGRLQREAGIRSLVVLGVFLFVWEGALFPAVGVRMILQCTGLSSARMALGALRWKLEQHLDALTSAFPGGGRIEPELTKIIGTFPVASLSLVFTNLAAAGLQVKLYPTVQRYGTYTAFLDQWNASWIRDQGPRFLLFDGFTIDQRDPWAESPAMWLEIYRWYNTRLMGSRNLLLERRTQPRFTKLVPIGSLNVSVPGDLRLPALQDAVFWSMSCGYSIHGVTQKLLFRVPPVMMSVHNTAGLTRTARVSPEVLVSPVLGNYLPGSLSQFAEVFRLNAHPEHTVDRISIDGPGSLSYSRSCEAQFFRPNDHLSQPAAE